MTAPTGPKGEAPATTPVHPLDPLTAAEFRQVVGVLRRDRGVTGRWRFASIELQEPAKDALHAWSAGDPLRRAARAVCFDRDDGRVFAALVSLSEDRVLSFEHQPGQQPNMTVDEWREADAALRRDPRIIEALARRGITDMDKVFMDTWTYGDFLVPERYKDRRVGWTDTWYRVAQGSNPYTNPVNGLHCIVDVNSMEVLEIQDTFQVAGKPAVMGEYLPHLVPGLRERQDLKPLQVTQPEGASFTLDSARCAGRSGRCGWASTTARGWCCAPSATTTGAGSGPSRTGCRSRRWSCLTGTPPPTTRPAPPSTSGSGAWDS